MMKRALIVVSSLAAVLALTPGISAGQTKKASASPEAVVYDAATAMEFFKTLSGEWQSGALGHEHGNAP
jgi:hypothetical protein